jgi:hypothetical protein
MDETMEHSLASLAANWCDPTPVTKIYDSSEIELLR